MPRRSTWSDPDTMLEHALIQTVGGGAMDSKERERLRELHYMKCPKCGMDLSHFEMNGVELDRCEDCGGIWFDVGEVEDLLEEHWTVMKKIISTFRERTRGRRLPTS